MGLLIQTINGENRTKTPPIWLMRQAGRYLPEYRAVRTQCHNFLDLCYNPKLACEVTMQPLRRFGFSAAILFSDILVIPDALGMGVEFLENEGPKLNPNDLDKILNNPIDWEKFHKKLQPVYETLTEIQSQMRHESFTQTDLIGFAGAPFTLACYMVDGHSGNKFAKTIEYMHQKPAQFQKLLSILTEAIIAYLQKQGQAGANLFQLFDSWAGFCPPAYCHDSIFKPHAEIQKKITTHPIIMFPRGINNNIGAYNAVVGAGAISIDQHANLADILAQLPTNTPTIQGNLSPDILIQGGPALETATKNILSQMHGQKFIFNLGHGIDKNTPIAHVEQLLKWVRA